MQRRVYDSLNVFMAVGVITKERQGLVKFNDKKTEEIFQKVDWGVTIINLYRKK